MRSLKRSLFWFAATALAFTAGCASAWLKEAAERTNLRQPRTREDGK